MPGYLYFIHKLYTVRPLPSRRKRKNVTLSRDQPSADFSDCAISMPSSFLYMNRLTAAVKNSVIAREIRKLFGAMRVSNETISTFMHIITYACSATPIASPARAPTAERAKFSRKTYAPTSPRLKPSTFMVAISRMRSVMFMFVRL